jgi:transposase
MSTNRSSSEKDPKVRSTRRRFTADEKLRILADYEAAENAVARGAILRHEGLYSSHIAAWRQQRDNGMKAALDRKRGPERNPLRTEIEKLRRERERHIKRIEQLERVIEIQGKFQALLHELDSKETAPIDVQPPKKRFRK